MLAEGVPDSVVLTGPSEVVSMAGERFFFLGNDAVEDGVDRAEELLVAVEFFGDKDAWTVEENGVPFILERRLLFGGEGVVRREVVDGDVVLDGFCEGVLLL